MIAFFVNKIIICKELLVKKRGNVNNVRIIIVLMAVRQLIVFNAIILGKKLTKLLFFAFL